MTYGIKPQRDSCTSCDGSPVGRGSGSLPKLFLTYFLFDLRHRLYPLWLNPTSFFFTMQPLIPGTESQ